METVCVPQTSIRRMGLSARRWISSISGFGFFSVAVFVDEFHKRSRK